MFVEALAQICSFLFVCLCYLGRRNISFIVIFLSCGSLYLVFIHIILLIEKDICDCRNVSVKLPCVHVCLSSGDLFIFSIWASFISFFVSFPPENFNILNLLYAFVTALKCKTLRNFKWHNFLSNDKNYVKKKEREQHLPGYFPKTSLECTDVDEKKITCWSFQPAL